MNRIKELFTQRDQNILSVYFTAGFPELDDTLAIARALESAGVDMIEIGIPFSDPVADGPTIQESNGKAIANGITLVKLFEQLKELRKSVSIPVILMGYINPILQFGMDRFCDQCKQVGVDGTIIPDLPIAEYAAHYDQLFDKSGLRNIFLITPQTSEDRIREIDHLSDAFIYAVSTAGTTGARDSYSEEVRDYFRRIKQLNLTNPVLVGFGISNSTTFNQASEDLNGGIIGSAFIKALEPNNESLESRITHFVDSIKN